MMHPVGRCDAQRSECIAEEAQTPLFLFTYRMSLLAVWTGT